MLRLLADHNIEQPILDGLRGRIAVDLVTARDVGLETTTDPELLNWAPRAGRVLLTHDHQTMPRFAYDRLRAGRPLPGVIVVQDRAALGRAVDDLHILVACGSTEDFQDQVQYLPWPNEFHRSPNS